MNWPEGFHAIYKSRQEQDIADEAEVAALLQQLQPAFVLNAAAYTAVDAAEHDQAAAFRTNQDGPACLARACRSCGAALIHISTDYVFDGESTSAYSEDDTPAPLSVYGRSKLAGEQVVRETLPEHLIVRTSWLHGALGQNFVTAMLRLGREREKIRVVADQFGRPTSAAELAKVLVQILEFCRRAKDQGAQVPWGTYHFADLGRTSRFELARYIMDLQFRATGRAAQIEPVDTSAYPTPARRPANAVLDTSKIERTFGVVPEPWQSGVERVVTELLGSA